MKDEVNRGPASDAGKSTTPPQDGFVDPWADDGTDLPIRKRRRWPMWLLILAVLIGGGFGFFWWRDKASATPTSYRTAAVSRGDITQSVTANGQITPVKTVEVGSQVSGMITELMVDYNSRVTNGQIVAQLDPSTYRQLLVQAEADLANARAAHSLAEMNFRRAKDLHSAEAVSRAEFEKADVDLQQAQASLKSREAQLKKVQVDLERTTIYSPIDGIVISRAVDVGQTVAASLNAPTLFTIAKDLREMRIEAAVSEADVGGVEEGQSVQFTVDAFPGRTFHGRVSQVRFEPVVSQNVVTYVAIVDVRNDDLKLRPGMTANASIITAQRQNVVRLPASAMRFRPPEGATIVGATNAPTTTPGGTDNAQAARPAGGSGEFSQMSPEERRRRFESMSPEERAQMRARFGGGGGGGRQGRGEGEAITTRTIYLAQTNSTETVLKSVTVKTGAGDGSWVEVLEGLSEGDVVATGLVQPVTPPTAQAASPNPFSGGGRTRIR